MDNTAPIVYRQEPDITAEDLALLFDQSGIRRPTDDKDRLARMIAGADVIVTAWDGDRRVGIARALTDFSYACYLSDLAVIREYQGRGIGTELIQQVQTVIGEECVLLLVSAPTAMDFYAKIGLEPLNNAWMIKRTR